ncbi:hypothetical protein QPJ54_002943 [Listeria monocytogenes]|uniref:hypothetical protein n=2 Tax=Listeria TaxID=1637 RepID=UPI0010DEB3F3|nr:hypothetical protein [Listeria welshimeri]EAD7214025.1 hypothetical protein [Listeria monocytogenes]EAF1403343.1 hypothetical protein [Listeria monocytogenes]EAL8032778.1 hypothetical protein [Listeria monocytogenes]EBF5850534.1 hypothetical protein [Listeria monocytogenes]EGB9983121.1 hypothetical protein [Listeria monocytogenes]
MDRWRAFACLLSIRPGNERECHMKSNQSELTWQMIAKAIVQNNWEFNGVSVQEMKYRLDRLEQLKGQYQQLEAVPSRLKGQKGVD